MGRLLFTLALMGLLTALCVGVRAEPMQFTDVTLAVGISHERLNVPVSGTGQPAWIGGGAAAEDFDGDGWLDLFVVQALPVSPHLLYMNNGDGTFREEAALRGADLHGYGMGATAADYDNDGDFDILVTDMRESNPLLINDGTGHFTVDRDSFPLPDFPTMSSSFGDVDGDGLLDVAITRWNVSGTNFTLYHNRGEEGFVDVNFQANHALIRSGFSPRFADMNGDRRQDIAIACDFGRSRLFINEGDFVFTDVTQTSGVGIDENGMGSAIGDYDNDGDLDWFVTAIYWPLFNWNIGNRLYQNRGDGTFEDVTEFAGVKWGDWGWGASFGDLDLDGDLDIYHVNGWGDEIYEIGVHFEKDPSRLFENRGLGFFDNVAPFNNSDDTGQGRGTILADFDNDGDLDIFNVNNMVMVDSDQGDFFDTFPAAPLFLRNDTVSSYHWIKVILNGEAPFQRQGVGSRVYVVTGPNEQMRELHASTNFLASNPGRIAHFGLGGADMIDEVRAEWPNGDATFRLEVSPEQVLEMPSPRTVVSTHEALSGEIVYADGASVEPIHWERQWVVNGQMMDNPIAVPMTELGTVELRLELLEEGSGEVWGGELIRVQVRKPLEGMVVR